MKLKNDKGEILKAGCVVVDNNRNVLLVTDSDRKIWSYPKGHMEQNENEEQTATRETFEETGYRVKVIKRLKPDLCYVNEATKEPIRVVLFFARPFEQSGKAYEQYEWVQLKKAKEIVWPNLKHYLEWVKL